MRMRQALQCALLGVVAVLAACRTPSPLAAAPREALQGNANPSLRATPLLPVQTPEEPSPATTTRVLLPADLKVSMLWYKQNARGDCSMDLRISKPVGQELLGRIAEQEKRERCDDRGSGHLAFLLPAMPLHEGAWAIVDVGTTTEVKILGTTPEQDASLRAAKSKVGRRDIGRWMDNSISALIVIFTGTARKSSPQMEWTFNDGKTLSVPIREVAARKGERKFIHLEDEHGEFYVIDTAGDLRCYDKDGFGNVARKVVVAR
jgi:hypothetical protein